MPSHDEVSAEGESSLQRISLALALALRGCTSEARAILEGIPPQGDENTESVMLEAEMVIAIKERRPLDQLESLATSAIEKSGRAMFALRLLGGLAERRRQRGEALRLYQTAHAAAPTSDRSLMDYARLLASTKHFPEALAVIKEMRPSLRREIYRLSVLLRGPAGVGFSVLLGLLILEPISKPGTELAAEKAWPR